jgi:predicted outer membrane protein
MRLSTKDFLCLTLWQFIKAKEHHERAMVDSWRQTRMVIHTYAQVMGGKKSVPQDLTKFLPLPFDEDYAQKKSATEQEKENLLMLEKFKKLGYLKPLNNG